jgi:hypothetical protein
MPDGKPAGVRCVQLTGDNLCLLFGKPERPAVCTHLRPMEDICGTSTGEALVLLGTLERLTAPASFSPLPAGGGWEMGEG